MILILILTSTADPGAGKLRVNNSNLTSATLLFLDDVDENGTDIQAFLRTIDDSTSTIKGHVKVSSSVQPDDFVIYTISATSEFGGFHRVSVSYVSGSVTSFSNGQDLVATFARTGDKGDTGSQGTQGLSNQGTQGLQGLQGITARVAISTESPSPADVGDFWYDNDDSALFIYYDSNQDGTGDQWIEIGAGPTGAQGVQGVQATQGVQGTQGLQGLQGNQGVQGLQGNQGSKVYKDYKVIRVLKGLKVDKVLRVSKVYKAIKEHRVLKAHRVAKVYKVYKVIRVLKGLKVDKVLRVSKVYKDFKVIREFKGLKEHKVDKVLKVLKVFREFRVPILMVLITPLILPHLILDLEV